MADCPAAKAERSDLTGGAVTRVAQRRPPVDKWHRRVLELERGLIPGHAGLEPGQVAPPRAPRAPVRRRRSMVGDRITMLLLAGAALVAGIAILVHAH